MTSKNKRLVILTLRNFSIAVGCIVALIVFGMGILFLNEYFGTSMAGTGFIGVCLLIYLIWMSIDIAKSQVATEEIRSKQVMETLKKGHFE